ncbi:MAG: hypothetical protein V4710_20575, partial [Verrucomicrobiota bacterium]
KTNEEPCRRTLGELIAESYLHPMIVPAPDLSNIIIHRLKNEQGEEEHIVVDLIQKMRSVENLDDQKARALDVVLQWGDVVEIPPIPGANPLGWRGLDQPTQTFLTSVLRRTIPLMIQGVPQGFQNSVLNPYFKQYTHEVSGDPLPNWKELPINAPGRMFSALHLLRSVEIDPRSIVRFSLIRPGEPKRDFTSKELSASNPILEHGDSVEIDKL